MKRNSKRIYGFRFALALLAAGAASSAAAQDEPSTAQEEEDRVSELIVYGDDPCPQGEGDEIVVCARRPETERYRIPKNLRENKEKRGEMSWGARAAEMEEASRVTRPGGCSVVGSHGHTGCFNQFISNWRAERRAMEREASEIP
ncbi:hypothetical protein [Sphingosinicella rhizophila]|uniref:Secreted protein n=1 Tax=Sphingosinicella rhizophila TaxID=3050082 RepID=A0ABU3QA69_9SPHN|nr:hypothetical protein [Sphingosinicella sp. GR2756]MDT9600306.1 hypothetical protein [Sphingosinicella sp. GR2756]